MTRTPAGAMLVIWNGIAAEGEADYYRWHDREHIPERLSVPGFQRGRRFVHASRPREFLTVYETASVDILASSPYLAQLGRPTPWSQRVSVHFRDMVRRIFRVVASAGRGEGGVVLAVRVAPTAGRTWTEALEALLELPGVVAVHVLEHDPDVTRRIGGQADDTRPWLVLAETGDPAMAERRLGERAPASLDAFRLQISVDAG